MRGLVAAALACGVLAPGCLGARPPRLPPRQAISITRGASADMATFDAWGLDVSGSLWRLAPPTGAGPHAWLAPGGRRARAAGTSSLDWGEGAGHQRVYSVTRGGALQVLARDGAVQRWISGEVANVVLSGPTTAQRLSDGMLVVAATGTRVAGFAGSELCLLAALEESETSYAGIRVGAPAVGLRPLTQVASAVSAEGRLCVFAESGDEGLVRYANGWRVFGGFGSRFVALDAAAVGAEVVVVVATDEGALWSARFAEGCEGEAQLTPLAPPPSGQAALPGSLDLGPLGAGEGLHLVTAAADGAVYSRTYAGGTWSSSWTLTGQPGDVVAPASGLVALGRTSAVGEALRAAFLGAIAPSAAHVMEATEGLGVRSFLAPGTAAVDVAGRLPLFGDSLTESHLTDRGGRMVVAASRVGSDADRVVVSISTDGGYTFRGYEAPTTWTGGDQLSAQGDPYTAIDSTGRMYVLYHEFNGGPGCPDPTSAPPFDESRIVLAVTTGGRATVVPDLPAEWTKPLPAVGFFYLDHPAITVTADDTQHLAWGDGGVGLRYVSRSASGAFSPVLTIGPAITYHGPYAGTGLDDQVYFWWVEPDGHRLMLCRWLREAGACELTDVSAETGACALGSFESHVAGGAHRLRAGVFALEPSAHHPNQLVAAFRWMESRVCPDPRPGAQSDIAFTESFDQGRSWSAPVTVHAALDGLNQFHPAVTTTSDGSVLVSYLEQQGNAAAWRLAVRRPGEAGFSVQLVETAVPFAGFPHKCGDGEGTRFVGDYTLTSGALTHASALRMQPGTPPRLMLGALSGWVWP